ncbi:D-hexose-6-phosphate mutarotase [Planctobacterium marinum]|uniref:Putative glucose-6-phosphate 1-epimerase n=1 Tax=Planctobacterium marinum TaxID=1631968 RepID=A0AA48HIL1_9ALTE|nr:D-hexose-6-phosphate mutarotase [Planctobacterium marinum]
MQNTSKHCQITNQSNNVIVSIDNPWATASISLFGAHVYSFIPKQDARERLWMSPMASLEGDTAIRGGTPICWPWFSNQFPEGQTGLPAHGYARSSLWSLDQISDNQNNETELLFKLESNGLPGFPYKAKLSFKVIIGQHLTMSLTTSNIDNKSFKITAALHTYFKIENLDNTQLTGISGTYRDKTRNFDNFEAPAVYVFEGETDRIHETRASDVTIVEPDAETFIKTDGHDSLVVWNPGAKLVTSIANIPNAEFKQFVCVEAAITTPLTIAPGNSHTLTQLVF